MQKYIIVSGDQKINPFFLVFSKKFLSEGRNENGLQTRRKILPVSEQIRNRRLQKVMSTELFATEGKSAKRFLCINLCICGNLLAACEFFTVSTELYTTAVSALFLQKSREEGGDRADYVDGDTRLLSTEILTDPS